MFVGNKNLLDGETKQLASFSLICNNCGRFVEWSNGTPYYNFEEGMTWENFYNSTYNNGINDPNILQSIPAFEYDPDPYGCYNYLGYYYPSRLCSADGMALCQPTDQIIPKAIYSVVYSCFSRDSLITLSNNTTKLAKDIDYNDSLLVWDFDNGCFAKAKPLWVSKVQKATQYYKLTFDDGIVLDLVGSNGKSHRVFNIENSEFTYGNYFHVGQHSFKQDQSQPQLVSIELVNETIEYINIITNYHMNLFANGILTSCGYNNIYPIKDMKFVKDDRQLIPFNQYKNIPIEYYNGLRLSEQDLSRRSIEKADQYVNKLIVLAK